MITKRYLPTLLGAFVLASYSLAQTNNASNIPYDSSQLVLEEVYDQDQGIREQITKAMQAGKSMNPALVTQMHAIDSANQARVNQMLMEENAARLHAICNPDEKLPQ